MNLELIKLFLDTCHDSRKITELMPKLPPGIKPRHIHVINTIYLLRQEKAYVKVSDVSSQLKVTKPSITKLIYELEKQNILIKKSEYTDKRIISLELTPIGEKYHELYIYKYHSWLSHLFTDIDEADMETTIQTLNMAYQIMQMHKNDFNPLRTMDEIQKGTTT